MIIDGKNLILGRLSTYAAKQALLGQKVDIINCEEVVITGNRENILATYHRKKTMGTHAKGPFWPRRPDMFVRKTIRGMLPYKQPKGRDAYKRIMCYIGAPEEIKGKSEVIKFASIDKVPNLKFRYVKEICKEAGWQR